MMKWKIIIIFVVIIILVLIGIFVYQRYERPLQQSNVTYAVFNIRTYEHRKSNQVSTGIRVGINSMSNIYIEEKTTKSGFLKLEVPLNNSYYFYNYNLEDQEYYTSIIDEKNVVSKGPFRVELKLVNPGKITISSQGNISDRKVSFTINSDGYFKNCNFCIDYSSHLFNVRTNYTSIPRGEFTDYKKCFFTDKSLDNEDIIIHVDFDYFGVLGSKDFIKILVFDDDEYKSNKTEYSKIIKY